MARQQTRKIARQRRVTTESGRSGAKPPHDAAARQGDSYVLRCAPGLSRILQAELRSAGVLEREVRCDILWQRNHDLLFLPRAARPPAEAGVRIAQDVHHCLIYGRYKVSSSQLDRLAARLRSRRRRWRLVVTADGAHFDRRDLARWLTKEAARRGVGFDDGATPTLFVFCVEQFYYACVPISRDSVAPLRAQREAEREGSLPPTIAAAMAFLGKPEADDVVLDPVCGSGTLLAEAHGYAPEATLYGVDTDPKAIKSARRNLRHVSGAHIEQGDGRACPLPDASISLVLGNLPFGKQYSEPAQTPALYRDLLREMSRLAAPARWRAILLAGDGEVLRAAAGDAGLKVTKRYSVRVRGEPAVLAVLARASQ